MDRDRPRTAEVTVDDLRAVDDPTEASTVTSRPGPLVAVLGTLVVSNVVANEVVPAWAYVPWNCGVAALLLVTAVRFEGCSLAELGLSRRALPAGLRLGLATTGAVLGVYLVGLALPATRDLFRDDRADVSGASLLFQALVAVPLGTVLLEEVAFRGVLPAMFRRRAAPTRAGRVRSDLCAAGLFGVWHVLPSWRINEVNPVFRDVLPGPLGRLAAVTGAVATTGAAGLVFSWMRNRTDSLAAPGMFHWSTNGLGYLLAWLVQR